MFGLKQNCKGPRDQHTLHSFQMHMCRLMCFWVGIRFLILDVEFLILEAYKVAMKASFQCELFLFSIFDSGKIPTSNGYITEKCGKDCQKRH